MICVSAGSKSRLAKAAGAEVAAQSRQEKRHAAVARSTFASQNAKKLTVLGWFTFGSFDVEKWYTVVARSAFASQNVQNTSLSEHFWTLGCGKFARRCSEKHICKSKC